MKNAIVPDFSLFVQLLSSVSSGSKSHWIPAQMRRRNDESGGSRCFSWFRGVPKGREELLRKVYFGQASASRQHQNPPCPPLVKGGYRRSFSLFQGGPKGHEELLRKVHRGHGPLLDPTWWAALRPHKAPSQKRPHKKSTANYTNRTLVRSLTANPNAVRVRARTGHSQKIVPGLEASNCRLQRAART